MKNTSAGKPLRWMEFTGAVMGVVTGAGIGLMTAACAVMGAAICGLPGWAELLLGVAVLLTGIFTGVVGSVKIAEIVQKQVRRRLSPEVRAVVILLVACITTMAQEPRVEEVLFRTIPLIKYPPILDTEHYKFSVEMEQGRIVDGHKLQRFAVVFGRADEEAPFWITDRGELMFYGLMEDSLKGLFTPTRTIVTEGREVAGVKIETLLEVSTVGSVIGFMGAYHRGSVRYEGVFINGKLMMEATLGEALYGLTLAPGGHYYIIRHRFPPGRPDLGQYAVLRDGQPWLQTGDAIPEGTLDCGFTRLYVDQTGSKVAVNGEYRDAHGALKKAIIAKEGVLYEGVSFRGFSKDKFPPPVEPHSRGLRSGYLINDDRFVVATAPPPLLRHEIAIMQRTEKVNQNAVYASTGMVANVEGLAQIMDCRIHCHIETVGAPRINWRGDIVFSAERSLDQANWQSVIIKATRRDAPPLEEPEITQGVSSGVPEAGKQKANPEKQPDKPVTESAKGKSRKRQAAEILLEQSPIGKKLKGVIFK